MTEVPDSAALIAEAKTLLFARFDEDTARTLGLVLTDTARAENLPVVIDIRTAQRCLFHMALPGSTALNDLWVERKSATALLFHEASLLVGTRNREEGETLARHGLLPQTHADNGGGRCPLWWPGWAWWPASPFRACRRLKITALPFEGSGPSFRGSDRLVFSRLRRPAQATGVQITSSMRGAPVASITRRSKPRAMPLAGGIWPRAARKSSSSG